MSLHCVTPSRVVLCEHSRGQEARTINVGGIRGVAVCELQARHGGAHVLEREPRRALGLCLAALMSC